MSIKTLYDTSEPTSDQCECEEWVSEHAFACWYPQIGGYVAKCVVFLPGSWDGEGDDPCIDVAIWHDGEFPFHSEKGKRPAVLHHCDMAQFIYFANTVTSMIKKHGSREIRTKDTINDPHVVLK